MGYLLFGVQCIAMFGCVFPLQWHWPHPVPMALIALALGWLVWVIMFNRMGNWSVFPKPLDHAILVTNGPYRFTRHPMYSGVMLACLAMTLHNLTFSALLSWAILVLTLNIKARYEERLLRRSFADYEGYCRETRNRFIPSWF